MDVKRRRKMCGKRRRSHEDPSGANGESESGSKRLWPSTAMKPLSDRTLKLLRGNNTCFPSVSKWRQRNIKLSILDPCIRARDTYNPYRRDVSMEFKVGSYFDRKCPFYSQSFVNLPKVQVDYHLTVLDLLNGKLLSFYDSASSIFSDLASNSSTTQVRQSVTLNMYGKSIMICCVFVPSIWSSEDAHTIYHTALASHELASRDDFVMVVVPMMREGFTSSYSIYEHFLSGFSCLAVPFHETHRSEKICSALGFYGKLKVVIADKYQKVLYHGPPDMFRGVGGAELDCFPFTPDRVKTCLHRESFRCDHSLNELLGLRDADVLFNIEYLTGGKLEEDAAGITVSELKHKFVGVYMCYNGRSLRILLEVHKECRREKYELEIVLVCCPFYWQVPPELHKELIIEALASVSVLGWWVLPFDNTVCHRLLRMCEVGSHREGFFIVDPNEKFVDPYGLPIILDFGIDSYPFTRKKIIDKELQRKMGLRLNSLLHPWGYPSSSLDTCTMIHDSMAMLEDKIVVLYLYKEPEKFLADRLAAWYKEIIKERDSSVVEVVAVSIDGIRGTSDEDFMALGWLVCPADPAKSAKLCGEIFHPLCGPRETLVAFDEDGQITSMDPSHILESQRPFLANNLRQEIVLEFDNAGFGYMSY
ncbi:unnamed protein product [Cuscuta campestris]|uniref:Thioredoxin-like fold domain-containing protein n=1 Tax=Cuscuta campestris TaxID=132261 RepID=A0A484NQ74_9ASTE|nr:unnamed protein product [Cuscuta campestris]